MERFNNKVIIVTGGATGIGKSICELFAGEGGNVIFMDRDAEKGLATQNEIKIKGGCAYFIKGNVTEEKDIKKMIDFVVNKFGGIDALVNNVGVFNGKGLKASKEDWISNLLENVVGTFLCIKYTYNNIAKGELKSIVNIASTSGIIAQPNYLLYNTSKAALINMVRCLALDLASFGIRVNNVCPGTVWTENNAYHLNRDYKVDYEGANLHPDIGGKHPIGRIALPIEIAKSVAFLISPDSSFITGENLMVDGGYTIV